MTVSVTNLSPTGQPTVSGSVKLVTATVTFDSSYPTNGESVTPEQFGLNQIHAIFCSHNTAASRLAVWNGTQELASRTGTNAKIKLFTAMSTEAANASDQSTITVQVLVVGI